MVVAKAIKQKVSPFRKDPVFCAATALLILLSMLLSSITTARTIQIPQQVLDRVEQQHGSDASKRLLEWQQLINNNQGKKQLEKLKIVNRFFNKTPYVPDDDLWGQRNYWATPIEFLSANAGDCEDYSLAKYFTLKALGVPVSKMRLSYVKSTRLNQAHMVLTYYESPGEEPLILDNTRGYILYASERTDLEPVYSFNGDGLWLTKSIERKSQGKRVGSSNNMKLWIDLKKRMADEGLDY